MNLVKCNNGHFYDSDKYQECPHCNAPSARDDNLTVPVMSSPANDAVTVALDATEMAGQSRAEPKTEPSAAPSSLQDAVKAASSGAMNAVADDNEKTVGFFSNKIGTEPVVGWLVCVAGPHFGEDFKLKSGRNFIGRAPSMDVAVTKDGTVSRERHTVVVYEPKGNVFIIQTGDSKELCYLNGEVVLTPKELKAHDRLTVGDTVLMFIPCCTPSFNWDMVKPNEEEKK